MMLRSIRLLRYSCVCSLTIVVILTGWLLVVMSNWKFIVYILLGAFVVGNVVVVVVLRRLRWWRCGICRFFLC